MSFFLSASTFKSDNKVLLSYIYLIHQTLCLKSVIVSFLPNIIVKPSNHETLKLPISISFEDISFLKNSSMPSPKEVLSNLREVE